MADDRFAHAFARIGDEGRQQAGGAKARDAPDAMVLMPSIVRTSLNSTPPPPFTCVSMKPGASKPFDRLVADACARVHPLGGTPAMRPSSMTTARPSSNVRAVEDPGAGERDAHHTVSVTLRSRGGLSGLRPRACAMALTSG